MSPSKLKRKTPTHQPVRFLWFTFWVVVVTLVFGTLGCWYCSEVHQFSPPCDLADTVSVTTPPCKPDSLLGGCAQPVPDTIPIKGGSCMVFQGDTLRWISCEDKWRDADSVSHCCHKVMFVHNDIWKDGEIIKAARLYHCFTCHVEFLIPDASLIITAK